MCNSHWSCTHHQNQWLFFFQKNEVELKRTGHTVTVPDNDVARLMYYLNCVYVAVQCEQDSEIRRFTNYSDWRLSEMSIAAEHLPLPRRDGK